MFTATSSQGLLYMHEVVHWASRVRMPIVMAIVSRTINAPWNIWPDHSDFMDQRDAGWIMSYAMDNQEVFDLTLQAFKISEDPRVFLPAMVGLEGFILGHTSMPVEVPDEEAVDDWLGPRRQPYIVDGREAIGVGGLTMPEDTEDLFHDIHVTLRNSKSVINEVDREYGKLFGRSYGGLVQCHKCSNAKYHAISMGAWSGDLFEAVDKLRDEGYPVGAIRVRFVRPFPDEELASFVAASKGVFVFERSVSFGSWGPIFADLAASILSRSRNSPQLVNVIAGIAGVNVTSEHFHHMLKDLVDRIEQGELVEPFTWKLVR